MCGQCGCSALAQEKNHRNETIHDHSHGHDGHNHSHSHLNKKENLKERQLRRIQLEEDILSKNNQLADRNRKWFVENSILALNLMSSPGAGKTLLLERTIQALYSTIPISVLEGDQETANDAERIRSTGCDAVQINTGTGCHLDAEMVFLGMKQLKPKNNSILMIENVGNLVCPALFDLGERIRVVILSITEGEDKPLKYPHMFRASHLMIINKMDLLPYIEFDLDQCIKNARQVNPKIQIILLSALKREGLDEWYAWLKLAKANF